MPPESGGPDRTDDGRYVIIKGRRWRATDPAVPEDAAAALRSHLMAARRAVREAARAGDDAMLRRARERVQRAKVALGERGDPWWEQSGRERVRRWRDGLAWFDDHGEH
ncbi:MULTISPECIES: hypothetical protein [Streptomyces]|uniref:hypothetical protein n=1 Tax=Streptomyces TaxID=1883 RepID=UPI0004CB433D|nr:MULTISPECIES: hypothetical protein [Streptomyces]MDX2920626.1 hypothetical protein [Streptomyces sp. NE06-03C]MDX3606613.1 hypothetical protein [Streptomyces sp. FL06-04B]MDX3739470.1 hypothetical protein [Streptomyces sp. ID01-15D]